MELGYYDVECYLRPATADRAHAVDGLEWARTVHWREAPPGDFKGAFTTWKVDIIGWVVQLICEEDPDGDKGAWKILGVKSPFHKMLPGQWLQPVERVVFQWERLDFDPLEDDTFPWKTTATDYVEPGEHYQASTNQCSQIIRQYINGINPETDLDPSALVPKGKEWEEAHG
jgi:hypothetical protein